jgi:acetolactate synthase-1/2/3 large subunit
MLKGLTGAQIIYKKLLQHNVTDVFAYTGGAIMPLIDTLYKNSKINYYINTHEQSGSHAATGYAKSSGKPGICIMTSGPGVTNSITGLTDATNDSTPLILFTGNVQLSAIGTNAFQECPATEITKPITKWSYMLNDINDVGDVVDEAFRVATSGKPGAVHIDIPKCVLTSKFYKEFYTKKSYNNVIIKPKKIILNDIDNINKLINNAKKPILLIGQGCNDYSEQLRKFAIKANIPVTTTIHAMGVFDETHELSLEFLGMHGNVAANYAIQESDLIIALGTRFDDRITGIVEKYAPKAFKAFKNGRGGIIHVNKNDKEIGNIINSHYNFHADCGDFLKSLKPNYVKRKKWISQINNWKKEYKFNYNKTNKLKTQQVLISMNQYLSKINNYQITSGVGNHQMMAAQFIKWKYPKTFFSSGSLGVMGTGLPYAIGCQIANPDKLIIDIDGDGSFNHTFPELKTVNNYNLPIKIAIMNDGHFSMVRTWEKMFFNERYTATNLYNNPDYVKLAEAHGIKSIYCDNIKDLDNKINEFLSYDKAILCEFKVETDECLPLVKPGSALNDIILPNTDYGIIKTNIPPS